MSATESFTGTDDSLHRVELPNLTLFVNIKQCSLWNLYNPKCENNVVECNKCLCVSRLSVEHKDIIAKDRA